MSAKLDFYIQQVGALKYTSLSQIVLRMLISMELSVSAKKDFSKYSLVHASNVHHHNIGMGVSVQSRKDAYRDINGVINTTAA